MSTKTKVVAKQNVGYKKHRKGTKVEVAHRLFDELRAKKAPRSIIVAAMVKKAKVTQNTASNWTQTFRRK